LRRLPPYQLRPRLQRQFQLQLLPLRQHHKQPHQLRRLRLRLRPSLPLQALPRKPVPVPNLPPARRLAATSHAPPPVPARAPPPLPNQPAWIQSAYA
jgi:hypothetical protein